jgi:hypothetical protein
MLLRHEYSKWVTRERIFSTISFVDDVVAISPQGDLSSRLAFCPEIT